jgi:hypothetical protein
MNRALKQCQILQKPLIETKLRDIVLNATTNNTLWTLDWDNFPLPSLPAIESPQITKSNDNFNSPQLGPPVNFKVPKRKFTHAALLNHKEDYEVNNDISDFSHLSPAERAIEEQRLQQRLKRFKGQQDDREMQAKAQSIVNARQRAKFLAAGAEGNPSIIDWDRDTVVGTCTKL